MASTSSVRNLTYSNNNTYNTSQAPTITSAPVSNATQQGTVKQLNDYSGGQTSTVNASGAYKGASVTADDNTVPQQHWAPSAAIMGLGNIDFGAEDTHYTGNMQNYSAQIYSIGSQMNNFNTASVPPQFRDVGGAATQFNMLNEEELHFANSVISQLTLNPPSSVPPVVYSTISSMSPYTSASDNYESTGVYKGNNPHADAESRGGFDLGKAVLAGKTLEKGANLISKFWNISQSSESAELLGESIVEGGTNAMAGVGLEEAGAGLLAGGAELLGGTAAVGVAIAGAEIAAGAAVVGLGIYEGYRAFGGTEDLSSITGKLSSGINSIIQSGEHLTHWYP